MNIRDLDTNELMSAGELIRSLIKRSGLSRNKVHEEMKRRVGGRSIGAASKLSDIFADRRQLPLRDLIPLFDSIPMKKSERDYYLCELIKAYTDSNIHRYIASPNKLRVSNHNQTMLIESLKNEIKTLNGIIFRNELAARAELLGKDSKKVDWRDFEEPVDHFLESAQLECEASSMNFNFYLFKWIKGASELARVKESKEFLRVISCCLYKDVALEVGKVFRSNGESTWDWLNDAARKSTILEVNSRLFNIWRELYPEALRRYIDHVDDPAIYLWKKQHGYPSLYEFLMYHHMLMKNYFPNIFELLNPMSVVVDVNLHGEIKRLQDFLINKYIEYIDSGWSDLISFDNQTGEGVGVGKQSEIIINELINTVAVEYYGNGVVQAGDIETIMETIKIASNFDNCNDFVISRMVLGSLSEQYKLFSIDNVDANEFFGSLLSGSETYSERVEIFQSAISSMINNGLNSNSKIRYKELDLEHEKVVVKFRDRNELINRLTGEEICKDLLRNIDEF